jgi:hypothetical protein
MIEPMAKSPISPRGGWGELPTATTGPRPRPPARRGLIEWSRDPAESTVRHRVVTSLWLRNHNRSDDRETLGLGLPAPPADDKPPVSEHHHV